MTVVNHLWQVEVDVHCLVNSPRTFPKDILEMAKLELIKKIINGKVSFGIREVKDD